MTILHRFFDNLPTDADPWAEEFNWRLGIELEKLLGPGSDQEKPAQELFEDAIATIETPWRIAVTANEYFEKDADADRAFFHLITMFRDEAMSAIENERLYRKKLMAL